MVIKKDYGFLFDLIPIVAGMGILVGFGGYLTLFGFFISSVLSLIFKSKNLFIISIPSCIFLGCANYFLGGKVDSLLSLLFLSGIFFMLYPILKLKADERLKKVYFNSLFVTAILFAIPVLLGLKTVSSFNLFFDYDFFQPVSQNEIILSLLFFAFYYFFANKKVPKIFFSLVCTCFVNFIFGLSYISLAYGINSVKFPASADFAHIFKLLCLSFLFVFVTNEFIPKRIINKKNLLLTGCSLILSSITGVISGSVSRFFIKSNGVKLLYAIFLFFVLFEYGNVAKFIPLSVVMSTLLLYLTQYLIKNIKMSFKTRFEKVIFVGYFLLSILSPLVGAVILLCNSITRKFYVKKN